MIAKVNNIFKTYICRNNYTRLNFIHFVIAKPFSVYLSTLNSTKLRKIKSSRANEKINVLGAKENMLQITSGIRSKRIMYL